MIEIINKLINAHIIKEYSKKLANTIVGFTFIFFVMGLAGICLFPDSAVQIVALVAVFVPIPVTAIGFFYNKAKAENEIKLKHEDVYKKHQIENKEK